MYEVPKDPAISAFAEDGVFVFGSCAASAWGGAGDAGADPGGYVLGGFGVVDKAEPDGVGDHGTCLVSGSRQVEMRVRTKDCWGSLGVTQQQARLRVTRDGVVVSSGASSRQRTSAQPVLLRGRQVECRVVE